MQVAVGEQVRRKIVDALQDATDVVLSHFHGDHIPLPDANPYQLCAHQVAPLFRTIRLWSKGPDGLSHNMDGRGGATGWAVAVLSACASWRPTYEPRDSDNEQAWENGFRLAHEVETLILDHHLLRCETGLRWLDHLASATGRRVLCAADFMEHPRCLLEAQRVQLYKEMPVPEGWHGAYANGDADTGSYRVYTGAHDQNFLNSAMPTSSTIQGAKARFKR
jgi:predicted metallo-beta-lactamase superfamily hydrolase